MGMTKTKSTHDGKRLEMTPAFVGGIIGSVMLIAVGTVFIGKSDSGEINVNEAIRNSNQAQVTANGNDSQSIGTVREDLRDLPNGGLVPQESQPQTQAPPQDTATTTGENTEGENASTTIKEGDETVHDTASQEGDATQDVGQ